MNDSNIEIYQVDNGITEILVKLDNDTVWLSLNQMAELFERDKSVILRHIRNVYKDNELDDISTVAKSTTVQIEGGRKVKREIEYYNLDAIISVGYRVNSKRGVQFRIWATKILKEYLIKGYSINEKLLIQQNRQLKELQESVKILRNIIDSKTLSTDGSMYKLVNYIIFKTI